MIWIFERRQRVRIKAVSRDLAEREAALLNDGDWSVGDIELLDKLDDEEQ